jgi:ribose transport system substrate-binding protein
MTKKLFTILAALIAVSMLLGACTTPAATTAAPAATQPPAAAGKPYIAVISKGFQHQFWQAVKQGAMKAGTDLNVDVTFEGPETEAMIDKQVEMIQTALDKKPAALCLAALDAKAVIPLLQKFQAAKIPVIGFDSGVDSDIPLSTAATDNIAAAALIADKMAAAIGGTGKVAIIAHDQTSRTGIDRVKGFVDQMKAVITANPDLKGYFGANEGSIIGVLNAVKELNVAGKLIVIGYDSGQQQMDAIKASTEFGAVTQDPIGIGYKCVSAAVDAIAGKTLPKTIDTGFHWYDKTNIDDPTIVALLYK